MQVSVTLDVNAWQALLHLIGNQAISTGLHPLAIEIKDQVEKSLKSQEVSDQE